MTALGAQVAALTQRQRQLVAALLFLLLLAIATAMLLPFRDDVTVGTAALALLLPVLGASFGGLWVGLGGAAVGALTFNFLFTKPYHSFRIEAEESVAAFVVYLFVATVLALVIDRLRDAERLAARRAHDVSLLQELTAEMVRNTNVEPTLRSALGRVVESVPLKGIALRVRLARGDFEATAGDAEGALGTADLFLRDRESRPTVLTLRERKGALALPVSTPDDVLGFIVADPGPHELDRFAEAFLESFAGVVAQAATRDRLAEEATRRRALEETDRLRTALFQSVSHDLRTPLTAIRAGAAALQDVTDRAARRTMLDDIEREAGRLSRLVESMLDLSRVESGLLRPRPTLMPVDELVWGAIEAAGARAPAKLDVNVPEELAPVTVDETMIRQVLVNLLENAAAYADESPVLIDATERHGRLVLRVVDHGPGIPDAERRRVFEPYLRLRPAGTRPTSSGLGLAISRGFVQAHGGTIRVVTTPGGGATFVIDLPLQAAAA